MILCKDCKYRIPIFGIQECGHPKSESVSKEDEMVGVAIIRSYKTCQKFRTTWSILGGCGKNAKFFEPEYRGLE